MGQQLLLSILLITTLVSCSAAAYAWNCSKHVSASHSLVKRVQKLESAAEEWNSQAEQFDLRLKRITSRAAMAKAREKLTETSQDTEAEVTRDDDKAAVRRKLGLVGASAQRAAYEIHARGGIQR